MPNITDQNGYPNCTTDPSNVNSNYDIVRKSIEVKKCLTDRKINTNNVFKGCYNKIQSMINQYSVIVIAVAIGVGVILVYNRVLFSLIII